MAFRDKHGYLSNKAMLKEEIAKHEEKESIEHARAFLAHIEKLIAQE